MWSCCELRFVYFLFDRLPDVPSSPEDVVPDIFEEAHNFVRELVNIEEENETDLRHKSNEIEFQEIKKSDYKTKRLLSFAWISNYFFISYIINFFFFSFFNACWLH